MKPVYIAPARPTSRKTATSFCENCEVKIIYLPSQTPGRFCSRRCHYDWRKGEKGASVRFWSQVKKKSKKECWDWSGSSDPDTIYGQFCINYKNVLAHRYSMELFLGRKLLSEELVLHSCDRPGCVNPHHLFLGSYQDNTNDMMEKGRHKTPIGENHPGAKLTKEDVILIRRKCAMGVSKHKIAKRFGIHPNYVLNIFKRKVWSHV